MCERSEDSGELVLQETETSKYIPEHGSKVVAELPPFMTPAEERELQAKEDAEIAANAVPDENKPRPPMTGGLERNPDEASMKVPRRVAPATITNPKFQLEPPGPAKPTRAQAESSTAQARASSSHRPASRSVKRSAATVEAEDKRLQGSGLRPLIHHRVVVSEVCLPLTRFTSSKQLVTLVYDSLAGTSTLLSCHASPTAVLILSSAHQEAYEKCEYMHRDVSAGNILIYPVLYRHEGKYYVRWIGILSDWELGKKITVLTALQPERTVWAHSLALNLLF